MAGQGMAGTPSLRTRGKAVAQARLRTDLGVRRQGSPVEANGVAVLRCCTSRPPRTECLNCREPAAYSLRVKAKPSIEVRESLGPVWLGLNGAVLSVQIRAGVGTLLETSRARPSAELVHDLRRDELEMVEVMQVEHLKIDPAGAHTCVLAYLVDDFVR
jgi:hypothetical protein